jgi:predicted amidophosphoribosyltransferase
VFKACPSCGEEYQSWVSRCSDCDVALDIASGGVPAPTVPAAPPAELRDLVLLHSEGAWYLRELAEALAAHDIPSRIEKGAPALSLFVRRADLEAAREVAREFAEARLPALEADSTSHDPSGCPACGEPLAADASACGACGLEFPEAGG